MNYAAILAGGTGRRMGGSIPKQFMKFVVFLLLFLLSEGCCQFLNLID